MANGIASKQHRKAKDRPPVPRDNVYKVPAFKSLQGPLNALLAPRVVDDPYDGTLLAVVADITKDPLGKAYAEGRIDRAQWNAGIRWLGLYEIATLGDLRGFELKTPVDGGGAFPEAMSDRRKKAIDELANAKREIGARCDRLLREVLGNRRFVSELAASLGYLDDEGKPVKRMVHHLNLMFKDCLEDLAKFYGYASHPNGSNKRM